ncbi:MAG: primosomal protein N' [Pseudomonadota bacterium]
MAIARVLFPLPLPEPFDYAVAEDMVVEPGSYVRAPLGKLERVGVVWDVVDDPNGRGGNLKPVLEVYPTPPMGADMRQFVEFAAKYTVTPPGHILGMSLRSRGGLSPSPTERAYRLTGERPAKMTPARERVIAALTEIGEGLGPEIAAAAQVSSGVIKGLVEAGAIAPIDRPIDLPFPVPANTPAELDLTAEQAEAADALRQAVMAGTFAPYLLDGVTGSGKTEVYFEAIAAALERDDRCQVLVLLPEIALTQAIWSRFRDRFGAAPAAWHSGLSEKERRRTWREVAHGRARIVLGARSALFLPYRKLGLIIIDEEHDGSFKQEDGVTYHARDLGVMRAKLADATIVMASATPALETTVNAQQGRYAMLKLSARPGAATLPDIQIVDMREHPPEKGQWLSPVLREALTETLIEGQQSLLFLNRRGYAPLVLCRACGQKLQSPGTESWMTEHRYTGMLVCHLTGFTMRKPDACPHCGAVNTLMGVGPGVERIAEEVRALLPEAKIEIFSSDTAQTGEDTRAIVERMAEGQTDIMVGTQIVAKGHNFPRLTLVGVVDADSGMKGGDLRAGERTFQLLSQVAGRAGRAEHPGRALIQTYQPDNPAMMALAMGDRDGFLAIEQAVRNEMGMPPFGRLAAVVLSAPSAELVDLFANEVAKAAPNGTGIEIFGPAPAPIAIVRGRHRRRFLVKSPRDVDLSAYMAAWQSKLKVPNAARLSVDIEPYSFL